MTTSEDKRFAAAVAAMQGILSRAEYYKRDEVAMASIAHADALLAELDRTAKAERE